MWHRLVALAALCASGQALTAAFWRGKEVHHKNGVKTDNRDANLQVVTSEEHHELTAKERHASGSDAWKKMGITQGAPCEYNKGDGKGWVRAASRSEAGRLTGVNRRTISDGLNKLESGEIYRASVGIEFRDVSVIEGKRGESWARAPAPYAAVEVSTEGRVRDCETERARLGTKAGRYVVHRIGEERIYEHDLVLLTWKGLAPPDKPVPYGVEFMRVASMAWG